MQMNKKSAEELESAIIRLESSGLSDQQKADLLIIIRLTHKHIYKSNVLVTEANKSARDAISKLDDITLYNLPVTSGVQ